MAGPFAQALITGATSGIGEAFAASLPARTGLLLTGRDEARLAALAARHARDDRRVETLRADLTEAADRQRLIARAAAMEVDLLINNAGLGRFGAFTENPSDAERGMLEVNVVAVVEITHALLPGMLARARAGGRRAGLIVVSSTAAFTPFPFLATYGASKAFELNFTEAIAEELRDEPIDVLALCPGATRTAFADRAGMPPSIFRFAESAERVASKGLAALGRQRVCVCGQAQRAALSTMTLPRRALAAGMGRAMRRLRRPPP